MGKKSDLNNCQIASITALLKTGLLTYREIATQCNVSLGSVCSINKKFKNNQKLHNRLQNCGRKRKTSAQDDRTLVRLIKKNPLLTAMQAKNSLKGAGIELSKSTICRRLNSLGCRSMKCRKVQKLTKAMKIKRLVFANQHKEWTIEDWKRVCFSDESIFECRNASNNRVWKVPNHPAPILEKVKHPTKVMVWAMVSDKGTSRLHICEGMMNAIKYRDVLDTRVLPQLKQWFPALDNCVFMQDKAPCHTAKLCMKFLEQKHVTVLDWPGNSPDLNPIENVWGYLKQLLAEHNLTTRHDLINKIIHIWFHDDRIKKMVQNSIMSMPNRIQQVISAKGGHTTY